MDKCPKCGNKLSSIDVLCPKCGALVEVVQIKKGTALQGTSINLGTPAKKTPQQNLIVYNEDWPTDDADTFSSLDERQTNALSPDPPATDEVSELLSQLEAPSSDANTYPREAGFGSEENYLAMFRNMKLPELADINTDIPKTTRHAKHAEYNDAEYPNTPEYAEQPSISAYREHAEYVAPPKQSEDQSAQPISTVADSELHRWLELEEFSDNTAVNAPTDIPVAAFIPDTALSTGTALPEETPRYRYRSERSKPTPQPQSPRGARRVISMIFVWLLVTGALFIGFFFLDQYVTEHYGTYQAMLYEWTNGNIDLVPSAESSPTPPEAPAP